MTKKLPFTVCWLSRMFFMLAFSVTILPVGFSQGVAINTTLAPANPSAGLDIDFSNKGFLISRVALTATTSSSPLANHVAGMIVYNTSTTGDVAPGLYCNDGTKWVASISRQGTAPGDLQYWNGTDWVNLAAGQPGQKLQLTSSGVPAWSDGMLPTLTTSTVNSVTSISASSGGNISSDGGTVITARGVCWSTTTSPTIANSKTIDAAGSGSFTSNITGLISATTYYIRAYATNSNGTSYGNEVSFVTP